MSVEVVDLRCHGEVKLAIGFVLRLQVPRDDFTGAALVSDPEFCMLPILAHTVHGAGQIEAGDEQLNLRVPLAKR